MVDGWLEHPRKETSLVGIPGMYNPQEAKPTIKRLVAIDLLMKYIKPS